MPSSIEKEMQAIQAQKAQLVQREKDLKKRWALEAEKAAVKQLKKYGIDRARELLDLAASIGHEEAVQKLSSNGLSAQV